MTKNHEIPFGRPYIDHNEKTEVLNVLDGHILTHGPKCKEFEKLFGEFVSGGTSISTSSCMASLHISAIFFGFGIGDEILVPAQTHVATVHAIEMVGATPVFIDCELQTGNIDLDLITEKITNRTKGIVIVHFAGIPVEMDKLMSIAQEFNLTVIEDCALALGAKYKGKHVGLWGDAGCFSFYPVKHITTGEGGMLISKVSKFAAEMGSFRAFNVDRSHSERKIPGVYDVIGVGLNYRMSEVQAALGVVQMGKIKEILDKRKNNFQLLKNNLSHLSSLRILDSVNSNAENSHYAAICMLEEGLRDKRLKLLEHLKIHNIGFSVYYPNPVPRMSYYKQKYMTNAKLYGNASTLSDCSVALPVGPHLRNGDVEIIADVISKFARNNR